MFSLWALATQGNFRQNPLNVVLCSAFILLVCYPPYLFSVGFQMSYLAVLGILSGHPILSRLATTMETGSLPLATYGRYTNGTNCCDPFECFLF